MGWARHCLIGSAALALVLYQADYSLGKDASKPKRITQQQANQLLDELKQIQLRLEKLEKEAALRGDGAPRAEERVSVKVDDSYAIGRKDAPVTLIEFADYQCPYCRQFHTAVFEQLRRNYIDEGKLRFVAMDLPLNIHTNAFKAAEAALCAGEQFKFWEMHDLLVTNSNQLEEEAIFGYAEGLQLDRRLFRSCLESDKYATKVKADVARAEDIEISSTPTFLLGKTEDKEIEGIKLNGVQSYAKFEAVIQKLLPAEDLQVGRLPPPSAESQQSAVNR